ncbi:MAG TPA: LLM class F420-dependent oxidoreductase [Candidatus Dormibacteraeota bacterium]|nr:LLM class F420-dependent oxidoreductase [Candidatus Dormibacteraeota bacterium]
MRIGIGVTNFSWPRPATEIGPTVARIARTADEAGIDTIWTMDHFFQIRITGLPPEAPMLEAYATLAFIAGQTRRIRLGTMVTSVSYRHPGVLIKTVTSLDVLSGGRMLLGVGAGAPFNIPPNLPLAEARARGHEVAGLGIPFPSLAERFERLEEVLQIAHQMWRGDDAPFEGRHYRLARPLNSPNSLQRPHPPILVGGSGERKTLRLVARYADACNLFDIPGSQFKDDLGHKLDVLRQHCHQVGRDYAEIEKTCASAFDLGEDRREGLQRLVEHLRELAAVGIEHVLLTPPGPWDEETLDAVASIVPEVHGIATAA